MTTGSTANAMVPRRPSEFVRREFALPAKTTSYSKSSWRRSAAVTSSNTNGATARRNTRCSWSHELVGTGTAIGSRATLAPGMASGERIIVKPYLRCGHCAACIRGDYHFCAEQMTYGVTIRPTVCPTCGPPIHSSCRVLQAQVHKIAPRSRPTPPSQGRVRDKRMRTLLLSQGLRISRAMTIEPASIVATDRQDGPEL